jgi:nucleoside-diphosphate-sugar epimerase
MSVNKSTQSENKNALIIGGAGFIGSYVCESLLAQNINVYAVDDLSSGKEENIKKIIKTKNFKFIHADINNGLDDQDLPTIDYIFHIGGIESYINGHDLTINTLLVNSLGTYKSLELLRKNNKAKYLLVSSLDIYNGVLSSLSIDKYYGASDRDNKKYTHHEAKRYAEALLREYFHKYAIDARVVRLADVYGPRMDLDSGTEIAQMIKETVTQDTINVNGDGLKIIRPTFVSDVVSGITKAMFAPETTGKIFNLVSNSEINVLNLAYTIQKNSTKAIKIQFNQNYTEIKFPSHKVELDQTMTQLGWKATTEINEGITQTLEYSFVNSEKKESTTDETNKAKTAQLEKAAAKKILEPVILDALTKKVEPIKQPTQPTAKSHLDEKNNSVPLKALNVGLLATSFFVILLLFIFPVASLYNSTSKIFENSKDAISEFQSDTNLATPPLYAVQAQKNIQQTLSQYDSLEWFFSMTKQRDSLETSRGTLNSFENLNKAIILSTTDSQSTLQLMQTAIKGTADPDQNQQLQTQKAEIARLVDNAKIDLTSDSPKIPFNLNQDDLSVSIQQAKTLFSSLSRSVLVSSNLQKFLLPSSDKNYLLVFVDSRVPKFEGGTTIGLALVKINSKGIQDTVFNTFTPNSVVTIDQAVTQGRNFAKEQKISAVDGVLIINTAAQKKIVEHIDQLNIKTLAQIVNSKNYVQKVEDQGADSGIQLEVWKEFWTKLKDSDTSTMRSVGKAISESILSQNIKLASVSSDGVYGLPLCENDQILYNNFLDPENPIDLESQSLYCINLSENSTTKLDNNKIKRSAKTKIENDKSALTYSITNGNSTDLQTSLQLMIPQSAKLLNVQIGFPVSFDKVKTVKSNSYTSYIIDVTAKPNQQTDIVIEWTDPNLLAADLSAFYVAKPFGLSLETNSIESKGLKQATATIKNRDSIAVSSKAVK